MICFFVFRLFSAVAQKALNWQTANRLLWIFFNKPDPVVNSNVAVQPKQNVAESSSCSCWNEHGQQIERRLLITMATSCRRQPYWTESIWNALHFRCLSSREAALQYTTVDLWMNRPVDVVVAAHRCGWQRSMGSHRSRCICRSTPTTPGCHGY